MSTNRWKLTFEFDGSDFYGWQAQPDVRTVEDEIEKAFSTLYQQSIDIVGQGRTDAGVHAFGQVAHANLPDTYDRRRLLHAMKGLLPRDVALLNAEQTQEDFHARFDAISRAYTYKIVKRPSPLNRNRAWYVYSAIDSTKLKECAKLVHGEHDFINFCIPPDEKEMTTICTITESGWMLDQHRLTYTIAGNRFLRHMVRRLVGTMVRVSEGKLSTDNFKQLLSAEKIQAKGHSAPACGLYLKKVSYESPGKLDEQ